MAKHERANIRLSDYDKTILDKAAELWPSDADNRSELIRRIMWQWWIGREQTGGKTDLLYALLYMAMKDGDVTVDEAKEGGKFVRNAWKGESQP